MFERIKRIPSFSLWAAVILLLFLAQTLIFLLLISLHPDVSLYHPILEAFFATSIISAGLYIFTMRRVYHNLSEHIQVENSLRESQQELETQVEEHSAELLAEAAERQRAERQLKLRDLAMRAAATGIVITDRYGDIQWSNPRFAAMTGYSTEEVSGRNIRLLKSGQHGAEFYANLWSTIQAGQVWQGEMVNRRKDGSYYIEEQTITPVLDSSGEITHFIAIKQDISEKHQARAALESERERLFTVLNGLPALVYLKAPDYKVRFANQQFRLRFGEPGEELCYRLIRQRDQPCEECPTLAVFDEGKPHEWEWQFADGQVYQLYDYPFVDVDGSQMVLQLGIDVTERRQAEAKLEQYNLELLALSQRERAQRHLAEGLFQATLAISTSLDLDEVLEHLLDLIQRVIPYRAALVLLRDVDMLHLVRQRGLEEILLRPGWESETPVEGHLLYRFTSQEKKSVLINESSLCRDLSMVYDLDWARSLISAPLVDEEQVHGIITLFSDQRAAFSAEMAELLDVFSVHARLAIKNARLFEQVRVGQERMQALSHRLVQIQENERRYVAQELHDETAQALTALKVGLKLIEQSLDDPSLVLAEIAALKATLDEVMENLHRLAIDLRPTSLDHLGLEAAIRQYIRSIHEKYGLQIEFEAINMHHRLTPEIEINLYRIAQEALVNILRHAEASQAGVVLEGRDGKIVLIVEDNGVGFTPENTPQSGRMGVIGMQERAEMLGGVMVIESDEKVGTTIYVEVPYAD